MTELNVAIRQGANLETAPTRYVEGGGMRFAVTDPQAKALITWCATPDPEHTMLRAIKQPALVVSGSNDTMLPAGNAYAMFKALSNAQLLLYPDSGHGALFQHHAFFVSHVRTFLDA
jgi:pimeloyl-ACP methyl ester carboxylesterase